MPNNLFLDFLGPLKTAFSILVDYWWIYAPVLLLIAAINSWQIYVRRKYLMSLNWVLLEIKPPPDVQKSPKIAENIFSGIHGNYQPVTWKQQFFKGEVPNWFSFEIVGSGGDIHFYIRTPENLRNLVEAQIFAQYPDAEITQADDYIHELPPFLPNDEYDLFGTELVFTKEDAYPIKTYPDFEEPSGKDEFRRTDPLAPLAETMSSLQPGEHIWLQILIRPTGGDWVKAAAPIVEKTMGKKPKPANSLAAKAIFGVDKMIFGPVARSEAEKKEEVSIQKLSPGVKYVLEKIENKISKLGFKAGIRFAYIARKELFHSFHISAIFGTFKQLYANDMNSFKPNGQTITFSRGLLSNFFPSGKGFFANRWNFRRKALLFQNYKLRAFVDKLMIFNTEELATLYHLPGIGVKAPSLPRVEVKKGQPPAGLPIG